MDATHPLSSLTVIWLLDLKRGWDFNMWWGGEMFWTWNFAFGCNRCINVFGRIGLGLTLHLPLIYWLDLVLSQQNDIWMVSNISCDTLRAQRIYDYFIELERIVTSKDTLMWVTSPIHIKGIHKHVMFSWDKEQQCLGSQRSRVLQQHLQTI